MGVCVGGIKNVGERVRGWKSDGKIEMEIDDDAEMDDDAETDFDVVSVGALDDVIDDDDDGVIEAD